MPGTGDGRPEEKMLDAYNAAAANSDDAAAVPDPLENLPARVRAFLLNDDIAQPLKDLCLTIIPDKDVGEFMRRLERGDFDAHLDCAAHPMGGLIAQLCSAPKEFAADCLRAVAQHPAFDVQKMIVPYFYNGSSYISTIKDYNEQSVSSRTLGSWLIGHYSLKYTDIAEQMPRLLVQDYRTNDTTQPIAHHAIYTSNCTLELIRSFAEKAGNIDFINSKNAAGETLFFRLATVKSWYNSQPILNALSWLIDQNPSLVNTTDDAGWTVLDRYVMQMTSQNGGQPAVLLETGMSRLLMSANAELRRQSPPGLSLVDYCAAQKATTTLIHKPASLTRKP